MNMLWTPLGFFQTSVKTLVDLLRFTNGLQQHALRPWLMGLVRLMGTPSKLAINLIGTIHSIHPTNNIEPG